MNEVNESFLTPECLPDISSWLLWKKNNINIYSVGSIDADKYIMVPEDKLEIVLFAIELMDGEHTLDDIAGKVYKKFQRQIDMYSIINKMNKAGLICGDREEISEITTFSQKLIHHTFPEFSVIKKKLIIILYNIWFILSIFFIVSTVVSIIKRSGEGMIFLSESLKFRDSYFLGAIMTALSSIINIILHELSHILAAVKFGLQPSEFTMNLYGGFKLVWVVRIKGMYSVERYKRIIIMAAGIFTNISVGAFAYLLCMYVCKDGIVMELISKVMLNNIFMIMACSMPFNLSDGYYIFTQIAKRQNMRKRMFGLIGFSKEAIAKADIWDLLYSAIAIGFIIYGFVLSGGWAYRMALEFHSITFDKTAIPILSIAIGLLPLLFIFWINGLFIIRFIKLIKYNR